MKLALYIIGFVCWSSLVFVAGAVWCGMCRGFERDLLSSDEPHLPIRRPV